VALPPSFSHAGSISFQSISSRSNMDMRCRSMSARGTYAETFPKTGNSGRTPRTANFHVGNPREEPCFRSPKLKLPVRNPVLESCRFSHFLHRLEAFRPRGSCIFLIRSSDLQQHGFFSVFLSASLIGSQSWEGYGKQERPEQRRKRRSGPNHVDRSRRRECHHQDIGCEKSNLVA
jgi:hypothetical protein